MADSEGGAPGVCPPPFAIPTCVLFKSAQKHKLLGLCTPDPGFGGFAISIPQTPYLLAPIP